MDVQFGKIESGNCNIFTKSSTSCFGGNFFASGQNNNPQPESQQSSVRINDFDSNILEENAYQEIADDVFKIEHKIEMLENILLKINNEVTALKSLGAQIQITDLIDRKKKIESTLSELNDKYLKLGLGAKFSGQIANAVGQKNNNKLSYLSKFRKFLSKNVISKISKKFDYKETMKDALENLSNINSSVDELINMKTPYGETVARYEKLTAYLNKANVIHSRIAKNIVQSVEKQA